MGHWEAEEKIGVDNGNCITKTLHVYMHSDVNIINSDVSSDSKCSHF